MYSFRSQFRDRLKDRGSVYRIFVVVNESYP